MKALRGDSRNNQVASASQQKTAGRRRLTTGAPRTQHSGFAVVAAVLGAAGALGCDKPSRCWDDGSCANVDAGAESTSPANTGSNPTQGETSGGVAPASSGGSGSSAEVNTSKSDETTNGGPSPTSFEEGSTDGSVTATTTSTWDDSASEPTGTEASASSQTSASTSNDGSQGDSDSTSSSSTSGCSDDGMCGALVCVAGSCEVCDPSDHRGCETAEAGPRCRASEEGNRCVSCVPGDPAPTSDAECGINGRGTPVLECIGGSWQVTACQDPDVCKDDDSQVGETPCGPNGDGRYLTRCTTGAWQDDVTSCIDDDQCVNGTLRSSDSECGFSGYLEQQCVNGVWLTQSNRCLECSRKYRVPDPLFEASLSERNDIEANPLDPKSVKYIGSLDLSFSSIDDLTGIQCFTSLRDLNLGKDHVSDVTPLASLTELRTLNLAYNSLSGTSLAPLGALTELTYLTLEASGVSSLEGLQPLVKLEQLRAPYNNITDVSPLVRLTALRDLTLYGNPYLECTSKSFATLKEQVTVLYSDCP